VSRREQIKMSEQEVAAFLRTQRVVVCATNGRRGWPHVMPLWYALRDGEVWGWTYAKSQKTRNLERDPRAALQIEAGEQYHELRGVMIEAHAVLHRDLEVVTAVGAEILTRYGTDAKSPEFMDVVRTQAAKRVALQFVPRRIASWDHRKLGGVY
jgi:PPOX class probable F420-dependent enzyme